MSTRALRIFVDEAAGWDELTAGGTPVTRFGAPDLQQAQRAGREIAGDAVADLRVLIADDYPTARRRALGLSDSAADGLRYVGTLDGLTGLIADIFMAAVADGVTLLPLVAGDDVRGWATAVLARLPDRLPVARAA
ncbi:hypothetical protein LV457_04090 [Mycobacterium sp. MYCO198283]|uniref:hypothetical protein n=1 Tax=Mycobacterium sp. MYCO198283 TaxID=2883505 RepID=UPI001E341F53|nr:hypothetical protein [Mycobacterium sp. MYCO198283]MCG5431471.1 hypothetical protein [Mycobacterium sp. MYCO198283]